MSTPDDSHFDPDDPRLTAYALGELPDAADRAHVEALLAASPEARAELADIRALTASLTAEYDQDRLAADDPTVPAPANVIRLPDARWTWVRPWLAAAAVLFLMGLGYSMLPVFNSVQVKGSLYKKQLAQAQARAASVPKASEAAAPIVAEPVQELILPKEDPTGALLAQNGKPAYENGQTTTLAAPPTPVGPEPTSDLKASPDVASAPLFAQTRTANAAKSLLAASTPPPANAKRGDYSIAAATTAVRRPSSGAGAANSSELSLDKDLSPDPDIVGAMPPPRTLSIPQTKVTTYRALRAPGQVDASRVPAPAAAVSDTSDERFGLSESADKPERARAFNTAAYDHVTETPFLTAKDNPLSTFSVDVDTASYSIVRRFIEGGSLPPAGAVRIEEMLNYFPYDYAPPAPGDEHPFAVHLEGAACPWNPDHRLVRIALKGREMAQDKRPPSNLVFLIDVSGSMEPPERLPLIKESLRLLVERLTDNDRVAIVVYAGNSGLVLPSTNGTHKDTILQALDRLEAGGSTNGASGIKLAYKVAQDSFLKGGTNRVILATDGDFNVGTTSQSELVRLIEKEAKGGVFLTALGVGTDNLKDSTMQKLADHGNGNYAYLDRIEEAKKVLVEQMSGTLVTIAKDVKIQVEFNPATVNSYRLIGYEKRLLRKEDFNDDRVDAGEIGAGHSVTALYEVVPVGRRDPGAAPATDALKYQAIPDSRPARASAPPESVDADELLTVKIRHKAPDSDTSERSYETAFVDHGISTNDYANASPDFKFAAAVASFGLVLRDSPYKGNATLGAAIELAQEGKGTDAAGYRAGFIELARRAEAIHHEALPNAK